MNRSHDTGFWSLHTGRKKNLSFLMRGNSDNFITLVNLDRIVITILHVQRSSWKLIHNGTDTVRLKFFLIILLFSSLFINFPFNSAVTVRSYYLSLRHDQTNGPVGKCTFVLVHLFCMNHVIAFNLRKELQKNKFQLKLHFVGTTHFWF